MNGPELYLVGNRFSEFATQPGVQTVEQFIEMVKEGSWNDDHVWLRRGQGVTDTDWLEVVDVLTAADLLDRVAVQATAATPVPKSVVHKAHEDNVLISAPHEVSAGRFAADLRLDTDNELVIDHINGQHVPGMVIIEAARQMMMAVSNIFYLPMLAPAEYGYVLNAIECRFDRYIFPLDARLEMTMLSAVETKPKRMEFQAGVTVLQGGMVAAECTARYFAYESTALNRYERTLGARTIAAEHDRTDGIRMSRPMPASVSAIRRDHIIRLMRPLPDAAVHAPAS